MRDRFIRAILSLMLMASSSLCYAQPAGGFSGVYPIPPAATGGVSSTTCAVNGIPYASSANILSCDSSNYHYDSATQTVYAGAFITASSNTPQTDYYPTQASDTHWIIGVNADGGNDNDDNLTISEGSSLGSSNRLSIAPGGVVTIPSISLTTLAGAVDGSAATSFAIPTSATQTPAAAGQVAIDTTGDQLKYYGGALRVIPYTQSKSFVIDTPTASSDYKLWRAPYAVTITAIHVLTTSGTNVVGGLDEGDSNGANIVAVDSDITGTASSNVNDDGSLTNGTIASGGYVLWHTTSVSGSPTSVTITYDYTVDAT